MRYLHFDDICIDTHNQLLYRQGETINLAPKVYDLLVFLCQNSHRVISKDELMEQVWSGTLVTENAISRTLVKVRKALADDPKSPKFIITVPRKGYRMVVDFVDAETIDNLPIEQRKEEDERADDTQQGVLTNLESLTVKSTKPIKALLFIMLGIMTIIAINYLFPLKTEARLQTKQIKPLTREIGVELYPAVSPDLTQLAYRKEVSGKPPYINVENLSNHVKQSISHARGALSKPIWSPTDNKLAFLYKHNSVCMIYWAPLAAIKNKDTWQSITECSAQGSPTLPFPQMGNISTLMTDSRAAMVIKFLE